MGRSIYADEVGQEVDDTWVHKFWLGVQSSDVSGYLNQYEPSFMLADLEVNQEFDIKKRVAKLKRAFKQRHNITYEQYMKSIEGGISVADSKPLVESDASEINLGEHLLKTIKNMKVAGIDYQQLTIEC